MKKIFLTMALAMVMCACSSDEPAKDNEIKTDDPTEEVESKERKILELSRTESDIIQNQTGFAFDLLNEALKDGNGENVVVAPQSLATLLAMMANGADGATLAELMAFFGLQPDQLDVLNNLNKMLAKELPALDNNTTVTSANSLWVDPEFTVYDSFKAVLKNTFSADFFYELLSTQQGVDKLNQWCETNTNGMIKNFLEEPVMADAAIVNANYFNGNWSNRFDKSLTNNGEFTTASGAKNQVMMMHAKNRNNYYMTDDLHAVEIPYGNRAYTMTVILSKNSNKLPEVTAKDWENLRKESYDVVADLSLPKFTLDYKEYIHELLVKIGLRETFGLDCDFSKLCPKQIFFKIMHGAKIEVDEQGTKAAGVSAGFFATADIDGPGLSRIAFEVNKPFVFVIEESSTHTIMYAGAVTSL